MRRVTLLAMATLLTITLAITAAAGGDKSDKALLQGSWVATSFVIQGKDVGNPGKVKEFLIIFKGDKMTKSGDGKEDGPFAFKLDSTKKPKEIDMSGVPDTKGIYELKDDTLRIGMGDNDRPKSFEDAFVIVTLKKKKG